jgi:hypothetical protein
LLQSLSEVDKVRRAVTFEDIIFYWKKMKTCNLYLAFVDEATIYVFGPVNKENVHFWGSKNPHHCGIPA